MTSVIGRIKPHVFRGSNPDPNLIAPIEPSMGSQGHPQHSDLYLNTRSASNILLWVYSFPPHALQGEWSLVGNVGAVEEVSVGSGKPTDPATEIWYNTATGQLMVAVNGIWQPAVTQTPAPEEVIISPTDPHPRNPDTELWYDTSSRPGTLKAWVTDVWEPIGGSSTGPTTDEVVVDASAPTNEDVDIWYDTTTRPGVLKVRLPSGEWVEAVDDEVHVGPGSSDPYVTDPDATAQLWFGTDAHQLFVRIGGKTGHWEPVSQISPDEVSVSPTDPSTYNPAAELWFDTSSTPAVLYARVSGAWVPITSEYEAPDEVIVSPSQPRDQNTELWVDTSTDPSLLKAKMPDGSWAVVGAATAQEPPLDEVWVGTETPDPVGSFQLWYDTDEHVLRVKLPNGVWVNVTDPDGTAAADDEVWIGATPPPVAVPYELWVDLSTYPPILKAKLPAGQWVPVGAGDSEVAIVPLDPYITDPGTATEELWLDTSVDPHVFYARINDAWVPVFTVPDAPDEVLISPTTPRDANTELWVDTSTLPATLNYNHPALGWIEIAGDEVHVGRTGSDPYLTNPDATAQLWFDTDTNLLSVRIPTPAPGHWQPVTQPETDEVYVGSAQPDPADVHDVWIDNTVDPPVVKVRTPIGEWVALTSDSEPPLDEVWVGQNVPDPVGTYEIWYDTSTEPGVLKVKRENGVWEEVGSDEVHVGDALTDPYSVNPDGATAQLWYATDAEQLFVRLGTEPNGYWAPVAELPPNEVMVGPTDPITVNPAAELWFDNSTPPGTLKARSNGEWVSIGDKDAPDEVHTGPSQPMDQITQLWYDTTADPGTLKAKNEAGDWQEVGGSSEVEVTQVDPYLTDSESSAELWFDPGFNRLWARVNDQWIDAAPEAPNEFTAQVSEPSNPDVELWLDLSQNPAILMAKVNQVWQPIQVPDGVPPQPLNEVHIGPSQPSNIETELWYDSTSDPGVLKANVEGVWVEIAAGSEVEVNNIDPYQTDPGSMAELWFNPSMQVLSARVNNQWVEVHPDTPNEFIAQGSQPTNPDVELWFDTSTDPGTLMVKVGGVWVPATAPVEPPLDEVWIGNAPPDPVGTYEIWVDNTADPAVLKYRTPTGAWEEVGAGSEVEVTQVDPYLTDPASVAEMWYDPSRSTLSVRVNDAWLKIDFGDTNEFTVQGSEPTNQDVELWYDISTDPGILKVKVSGNWIPVSPPVDPPLDEVWIGVGAPDPTGTYEIWYDTSTEPGVLKIRRETGAWEEVVSGNEVAVGRTDPRGDPASVVELWYDTSASVPGELKAWVNDQWITVVNYATSVAFEQQYGQEPNAGTLNTVAREDHTHGTPPEEVVISDDDPMPSKPDTEFWLDTSNDPYVLKANINGAWMDITSQGEPNEPPEDEVWIGAEPPNPVTSTYEIWVDTSTYPGVARYKTATGEWIPFASPSEVAVSDTDPYTVWAYAADELWFDTSSQQLMVRVNDNWQPAMQLAPNEVFVGNDDPGTPDIELWYDTDAVPTSGNTTLINQLLARVAELETKLASLEARLVRAGDVMDGDN